MEDAWKLKIIGATLLFMTPSTAPACQSMLRGNNPAEIARHARDVFAHSAAIVDAEVVEPHRIQPGREVGPARLRPIRVLKGPRLPIFLVTTHGCDISFMRRGERVRVVLTGGPRLFTALYESHGADYADGRAAQRFLLTVDALAGAPLPRGFTRPGNEEPPPRR